MRITFYKNNSTDNTISKELTEAVNVNCVLKKSTGVINMVLEIAGINPLDYNYAYVPIFERYYFINDMTNIRNGLWEVALNVDVLMSFANVIRASRAIIRESENPDSENMNADNKINPRVLSYPIENPFTYNNLVMVGVN